MLSPWLVDHSDVGRVGRKGGNEKCCNKLFVVTCKPSKAIIPQECHSFIKLQFVTRWKFFESTSPFNWIDNVSMKWSVLNFEQGLRHHIQRELVWRPFNFEEASRHFRGHWDARPVVTGWANPTAKVAYQVRRWDLKSMRMYTIPESSKVV